MITMSSLYVLEKDEWTLFMTFTVSIKYNDLFNNGHKIIIKI